jgi:hypothetical protein
VNTMSIVEHVIETDQFSRRSTVDSQSAVKFRRLILIGLAAAMALATLAPAVVLAG